MNLRFYAVALMMGMSVLTGVAVGEDETKRAAEADVFERYVVIPKGVPVAQLPQGIPSMAGKVTLVADFARAKKGEAVDVYLINRGERDILLNAEDGDVYLKLEAQNADGTWARVQPHRFSWCGNSYGLKPKVEKECFYKIKGYQPMVGTVARIRFRLYNQKGLDLATEAGDGMVLAEEAREAAYDSLALRTGPFEMVRDLATGTKTAGGSVEYNQSIQRDAIRSLGDGRFPAGQVLPLLDEIEKKFPEQETEVKFARKSFNVMRER
ncbi:hypothetical protein [Prosthecobacter sp.]|uniref:hypothetical protein n=1 Tax=Prosthecobacter sp. TaxID=1965333 RepID=UPI003783B0DD